MAKLTVLGQLIKKWESELGSYIPNAPIYQAFINDAKKMLEKEKNQIRLAYNTGGTTAGEIGSLEYFEQEFRQK